ncbi:MULTISPECIES: hypothetical protein [unclassified Rhizobium]|uniref:hypothetical protein n=1 Tax=unclassified Rhizobium TaxID=2613769 RepID=UPI000CDF3F4D|nr:MULTISPECIES: hypothetical protein [Rhizobium]AVA26323.1 hypothetical protein NXC24_PC01897 [Rhizobium sp. NXC24]UWU23983.1 hypothetical protein N2601_27460 [Rhizobium tropici]
MTGHDQNPLLRLYGNPRAIVHTRVAARAHPLPSTREEDSLEKLGNSMASLISLKDHNTASR